MKRGKREKYGKLKTVFKWSRFSQRPMEIATAKYSHFQFRLYEEKKRKLTFPFGHRNNQSVPNIFIGWNCAQDSTRFPYTKYEIIQCKVMWLNPTATESVEIDDIGIHLVWHHTHLTQWTQEHAYRRSSTMPKWWYCLLRWCAETISRAEFVSISRFCVCVQLVVMEFVKDNNCSNIRNSVERTHTHAHIFTYRICGQCANSAHKMNALNHWKSDNTAAALLAASRNNNNEISESYKIRNTKWTEATKRCIHIRHEECKWQAPAPAIYRTQKPTYFNCFRAIRECVCALTLNSWRFFSRTRLHCLCLYNVYRRHSHTHTRVRVDVFLCLWVARMTSIFHLGAPHSVFNIFLLYIWLQIRQHINRTTNDRRVSRSGQTREKHKKWWREMKRKHDTNPMVLATRVVKMRWSVIPAQPHTAFEWTSIHS